MWSETMMTPNFQQFPPSDGVLTNIELPSIFPGELQIALFICKYKLFICPL